MNILFFHHNFPAQFRHIAQYFASSKDNSVVFISEHTRSDIKITGVKHYMVKAAPPKTVESASLQEFNMQLWRSEAYANALLELKKKGFKPDIIYDHPGWGSSLFVKDVFPDIPYVCFFEWYYTKGADYSFWRDANERPPSHFAQNRIRNLCQLNALSDCNAGITPTQWQRSTYPVEFKHKINVLHDGINTDYFSPAKSSEKLVISGIDLSNASEIVTYVARGLEPYRGFPQFFRSLPEILNKRKNCHIVLMGEDCTKYGEKRTDGKTYKELMLEDVPVDRSRVHFIGFRPYDEYRKLLRASSVHVYLTAPFVLSWSMLEAMSCGCLLVGSDTAPVREVIKHGENGFLFNFWDSKQLSKVVIEALSKQKSFSKIRENARRTVLEKYDLSKLLPMHESVILSALKCSSRD
ncbi:glycosyltransferase [Maridesulfovibrio zosterae]|uniref:glycosyltransferase n=1 Tax=Maridesulfovibrio zosterae TaxID=82171 RepID=UPI0004170974|nr:glycosyltransferase [Maridesulfovibrio zosterae]